MGIELLGVGGQRGRPEATHVDLLYGKFSTLASIASEILHTLPLGSYRKDSQERGLARILQSNHSYIHLCRPEPNANVSGTLDTQTSGGYGASWYWQDGAHLQDGLRCSEISTVDG